MVYSMRGVFYLCMCRVNSFKPSKMGADHTKTHTKLLKILKKLFTKSFFSGVWGRAPKAKPFKPSKTGADHTKTHTKLLEFLKPFHEKVLGGFPRRLLGLLRQGPKEKLYGRAMAAPMVPLMPPVARWEKKRSLSHMVHRGQRSICSSFRPARKRSASFAPFRSA